MTRLHILSIVLVLSGLTPAAGADLEYTLSPIGLVVAPPTRSAGRIVREWSEGDRVYNATFREPSESEQGVTVDCDSTHAIGVAFVMRKSGIQRLPEKKEFVTHVWEHSALNVRHRLLDHRHVKTFKRSTTALFDWELLDIDKKFKASGTWTLRTYIRDELVFEGSFHLIGCDNDRRVEYVTVVPLERVEPDQEEPEEPVEIVCRKERVTGSHRLTTVCRERPQMDRRRKNDQDMVRDIQTTPGNNRP